MKAPAVACSEIAIFSIRNQRVPFGTLSGLKAFVDANALGEVGQTEGNNSSPVQQFPAQYAISIGERRCGITALFLKILWRSRFTVGSSANQTGWQPSPFWSIPESWVTQREMTS